MQPQGGLKTKLGMKQRSIVCELTHRLRLIALGHVDLDESGMGAFSERLGSHGRPGSVSGLTPALGSGEAAGQRFQGMQSELPPVFGLGQYPIVIPAGQQVAGQGNHRGWVEVGLLEGHFGIQQPSGQRPCVVDVDRNALGEAKLQLARS